MDGYAGAMIARGPTLTSDRQAATGSMHMVDLPDAEAARVFAFDEPYYQAGVFGEVLVRRWRNALGGTMWDFEGDPSVERRFLVIGHGKPGTSSQRAALLGELPDRAAVDAMLADEPYVRAGLYAHVEVHDWQFGGRPA